MKYELVSLSIQIEGVIFKYGCKPLDDSKLPKDELEAAYKGGFIKPLKSKAKTPKQVIKQYQEEFGEQKAKELKKAQEEAKANSLKKVEEALLEAQKEADEAKLELKEAEETLEARNEEVEKATDSDMVVAKANFKNAKAAVKAAQTALDNTLLKVAEKKERLEMLETEL